MKKRGRTNSKKKGISPLIATVLIIGFTVGVALLVWLWGFDFVRGLQGKTELSNQQKITCASATLTFEELQQLTANTFGVQIENTGKTEIENLKMRILGDDGSTAVETNGLGVGVKRYYEVEYDVQKAGFVKSIDVLPQIVLNNELITCTQPSRKEMNQNIAFLTTLEENCGNGAIDPLEQCDGEDLNGGTCTPDFVGGTLLCSPHCIYDTVLCYNEPGIEITCGDGIVDLEGEQCDDGLEPGDFGGETCESLGYPLGGTLRCTETCSFDTGGCRQPTCPNGIKEFGERCDGIDLDGETCESLGYPTGILGCKYDCLDFDKTQCLQGFCGDGGVDAGEYCEPETQWMDRVEGLNGYTCEMLGYTGGTLACKDHCGGFDIRGCDFPVCGNGIKEGCDHPMCSPNQRLLSYMEECDVLDTGTKTCQTEGFTSGTLGCTNNCNLNTNTCYNTAFDCGNGIKEQGEECDGEDLAGQSCSTQGQIAGTLSCDPETCRYDISGCNSDSCGNNILDPGEICDGTKLNGKSCPYLMWALGGVLECQPDCLGYDTSDCDFCGNGIIDVGEGFIDDECDGEDFGEETCITQGFTSGTLSCTPPNDFNNKCKIDTSTCVA